jgi:hypothetical protein
LHQEYLVFMVETVEQRGYFVRHPHEIWESNVIWPSENATVAPA